MIPSFKILGTTVHQIDKTQLNTQVIDYVHERDHALVLNVNVQCLNS